MVTPIITGLYAGILSIISIALSMRVVKLRIKTGVGIGDKSQPVLKRARRAHANFTEYVPLALILIGLVEMQGGSSDVLHSLGAGLTAGRVLHGYGLSGKAGMTIPRGAGYSITIVVTLISAGLLIENYLYLI
jgi:uncharacterized membrane protein YecN with MAPEG domain